MRLRLLASGVLLFTLLLAGRGEAGPAEDRAAADALFKEGRALVQQGKYAEGCAKFAASQKLDPVPGTLLTLGDCYERAGQTASAWTTFNEAFSLANKVDDEPRATEAARRAGLLEPKLSKLMVEVAPGGSVAGLEVRRNGKAIDPAVLGSAIPVDPREHSIEASAPGKTSWSTKIAIDPKPGVVTVRVPALEDASSKVEIKPAGAEARRPWQRPTSFVVMGVGALGLGVGAILGGVALGKKGESNEGHCFPNNRCDEAGLDLRSQALSLGNASTALFIAGGVALAGGVVLFVTAPSASKKERATAPSSDFKAEIGIAPGGLVARGVF